MTTPAPHHSIFLQAGCPSCRPTNSIKPPAVNNWHLLQATPITQRTALKLGMGKVIKTVGSTKTIICSKFTPNDQQ